MMAPTLAMLAANSIFPLLYAVTVSFKNYQLLIPGLHRWVGFANYANIVHDSLFWSSLLVTLWFVAGVMFLQFPIGMALASLLNRLHRFQDLLVTLLLIPTIISSSVAAFQWTQLFNYRFGPVNYFLGLLHLGQPTWTADPSLALPTLIFVDRRQWTPFMTLLLFAGLRSLPGSRRRGGAHGRIDRRGRSSGASICRCCGQSSESRLILRILMTFKLFDIIYVLTARRPRVADREPGVSSLRAGLPLLQSSATRRRWRSYN